jgi:hypothetical protein
MSIFDRWWNRLRGRDPDPTIGTQIGLLAGAAAIGEASRDDQPAQDGGQVDYGWSGDHMSGGGSDYGGGGDFGGGGFDGGGGGGDSGGGGGF